MPEKFDVFAFWIMRMPEKFDVFAFWIMRMPEKLSDISSYIFDSPLGTELLKMTRTRTSNRFVYLYVIHVFCH